MPIDDELIDETINRLYTKLNAVEKEKREIGKLIYSLSSIKKKADGSMPVDTLTDNPMSEERRKEIFNTVAKNGAKYIGEKNG